MKLLNKFLKSEYLNIQFATVACLTNVFNKLWLNYDENKMSCVKIQEIHSKLADELQLQDLSVEQENDVDRKVCIVSTRLQSYCSIIGSCFPLRKQMWFNLIEFCCQHLKLGESELNLFVFNQKKKNRISIRDRHSLHTILTDFHLQFNNYNFQLIQKSQRKSCESSAWTYSKKNHRICFVICFHFYSRHGLTTTTCCCCFHQI